MPILFLGYVPILSPILSEKMVINLLKKEDKN